MNAQTSLKLLPSCSAKTKAIALNTKNFNVWIKEHHILNDVSVSFHKNQINCIIGPSGSGKSTLIRSFNRINDGIEGLTTQGSIEFNGANIYEKAINVTHLRTRIGMVFQKPCVFPKSISQNVLFGIQHLKKLAKHERMKLVENKLKATSLWKEVSHRLNDKAHSLSMGQQQRLCIARTLAINPEIILLDEPTSSLDPVSTLAVETLMMELKKQYTIVLVTHNILQAKRIADHLIFMCNGEVIEQGSKEKLFNRPKQEQTKHYLKDEFCEC